MRTLLRSPRTEVMHPFAPNRAAPTVRAVLVGVAVLAALCLAPAGATEAEGEPHSKPQKAQKRAPQPRPTYWGAWIGDQLTGEKPPWDMGAVYKLQRQLRKGLSLIAFSTLFADCPPQPCTFFSFPTTPLNTVRAYGAIPFVNWSSQSPADPATVGDMPDFQLRDLIAGTYDAYIREFALGARNWGHPFFLRFDWEMNGNWFPWSERINGNRPGEFVAAWRHVHDIFAAAGAGNVSWVWCPYVDVYGNFQRLGPLYPGDEYVDWTCLDGFNWAANPTNPHPWRSFDAIFRRTYRQIVRHIAPRKPMVLAEFASTGRPRAKAAWIREMFGALATRFRRIRGLIWFDQVDRGIDWPLETSGAALRAFRRGIRGPAYRANDQGGISESPIGPPRRAAG